MKRFSYMYCDIHKELNLVYSQMNLITLLPKTEVLYNDEEINLLLNPLAVFLFVPNWSSQTLLRMGCLLKMTSKYGYGISHPKPTHKVNFKCAHKLSGQSGH